MRNGSGVRSNTKLNLRVRAAKARRRRLLFHARRQFTRHGFSRTNLNEVIRLAGGSKASIAKFYKNKAGLIAAVIDHDTREYLGNLRLTETRRDARARLEELSLALIRLFTLPQALMAYRAAVGEGYRNRALAEAYYFSGRGAVVDVIARCLRQWEGEGLIHSIDPVADADRLTHMLRAGVHERMLLGLQSGRATPGQIEECVRTTVQAFLHGVQPQRGKAAR
ncbi:MAG: TetR/AcrR family transcriptional regulator [Candidatus Hydrogenedentes bacterium]|nr:TetR/AcrR family transcriptional regulator [Candidatus Hydrogenedentota bacterium]